MEILAAIGLIVLAIPAIIGIAILSALWSAWWVYPAWGWYLVPLGIPAISFWHFTALLMLLKTLTAHTDTKKDSRATDWGSLIGVTFFTPVLAWALLRWMR